MKRLGTYIFKLEGKDELIINNEKVDINKFCENVHYEFRLYRGVEEVLSHAFGERVEMKEVIGFDKNERSFELTPAEYIPKINLSELFAIENH
jgi:hypothetical protein